MIMKVCFVSCFEEFILGFDFGNQNVFFYNAKTNIIVIVLDVNCHLVLILIEHGVGSDLFIAF
jgi:hypothetical protein